MAANGAAEAAWRGRAWLAVAAPNRSGNIGNNTNIGNTSNSSDSSSSNSNSSISNTSNTSHDTISNISNSSTSRSNASVNARNASNDNSNVTKAGTNASNDNNSSNASHDNVSHDISNSSTSSSNAGNDNSSSTNTSGTRGGSTSINSAHTSSIVDSTAGSPISPSNKTSSSSPSTASARPSDASDAVGAVDGAQDQPSRNSGGVRVRVLTYNLLAQSLVSREMFPYASATALKWARRKTALMHEIKVYDPDVLCAQECDRYEEHWRPAMEAAGYASVFQPRPGNKLDGCATFFKRSRFRLVDQMTVQFNDAAAGVPHWATNNVAIFVRLTPLAAGGRPFVVTNHHLYYRQWYCYLRLRQLHQFARSLAAFNGVQRDPVVVCGDFNTTPDDDMYALMTTGALTAAPLDVVGRRFAVHADCVRVMEAGRGAAAAVPSYADDERVHGPPDPSWRVPPDLMDLVGDLQRGFTAPDGGAGAGLALAAHPTQSAYGSYTELDSRHRGHPLWPLEPWCTHYVLHYEGTLDYIHLHDGTRAGHRPELLQVLQIPTVAELQWQTALPNDHYASDHVALGADILLPCE